MNGPIGVVFLDVGGPIYDDVCYARALLDVLRERGAVVTDAEFWREYDRCRARQAGLTAPLAHRFIGVHADPAAVAAAASLRWHCPPTALYGDVLPTLARLAGRYRLGVLANQPVSTRSLLERDGIARFIEVWAISGEVGLAKPDPAIFAFALREAGCSPAEAVYVGNRLDNDVRPAKAAGLRTVWLLRGEAPARPTRRQLAEPDAVVSALAELPAALEELDRAAA